MTKTTFDRLGGAVAKAGYEHGDEIVASTFGVEIHGPNGVVNVTRSASDAGHLATQTYGLTADGGERRRQDWKATFTPGTPTAVLRSVARYAVDAIN